MTKSEDSLFTAIVPVTRIANKIENLESWILAAYDFKFDVIIIHDVQDQESSVALKNLIRKSKNPNIRYEEVFVKSPGLARNEGVKKATTEWVVFWDADDQPIPEAFKSMIATATKKKSQIALGNFIKVNENNVDISQQFSVQNFEKFFSFEFAANPGLWRFAFQRRFIGSLLFSSISMGEDQLFLLKVMRQHPMVHFDSNFVYKYFLGGMGHLSNSRRAREHYPELLLEILRLNKSLDLLSACVLARQTIAALNSSPKNLKLIPRILYKLLPPRFPATTILKYLYCLLITLLMQLRGRAIALLYRYEF